jgi:hypothetical protein
LRDLTRDRNENCLFDRSEFKRGGYEKIFTYGESIGYRSEKCVQTFVKYHDKDRFEVYVCGRLQGGIRRFFLK